MSATPTPDPGAYPLDAHVADLECEVERLERRIQELEIENRGHARMDIRLTALEDDVSSAWARLQEAGP